MTTRNKKEAVGKSKVLFPVSCFSGILVFVFLLLANSTFSQSGSKRDAIKVGYAQAYITSEAVFEPSFYLEYTRVFVPPITIGVSTHYAKSTGIMTSSEDRTLETFSFDFNGYYSFFNNDQSDFKLGFGISARVFKTDWLVRDTEISGQDNFLRPGISVILNYDHSFDPFVIGLRGSVHAYSNSGSVMLIGGHLGFKF